MNTTGDVPDRRVRRELAVAAGLLVLTGLATWTFLRPVVGPAAGTSGGSATPGVIACGVALVALVVGGTFAARPLLVAPAVALPFTAVWAWLAATSDDSGLWVVGAVLALVGSIIGTSVVAAITAAVRRRRR